MSDTQHFVVSIDEGNSQGVYCAYCGEKIVPNRDDSGSYSFTCSCKDAVIEKQLYAQKAEIEQNLGQFFLHKTDSMQINELRTRIVVYEQHVHGLKTRLQELMNKVAGVTPQEGVSTLVVKLPSEKEAPRELTEEVCPEDIPCDEDFGIADYDQDFTVPESRIEEIYIPEDGIEEVACHDPPVASAEAPSFDMDEQEDLCEDKESYPLLEEEEEFLVPQFDPHFRLEEEKIEKDSKYDLPNIEDL